MAHRQGGSPQNWELSPKLEESRVYVDVSASRDHEELRYSAKPYSGCVREGVSG